MKTSKRYKVRYDEKSTRLPAENHSPVLGFSRTISFDWLSLAQRQLDCLTDCRLPPAACRRPVYTNASNHATEPYLYKTRLGILSQYEKEDSQVRSFECKMHLRVSSGRFFSFFVYALKIRSITCWLSFLIQVQQLRGSKKLHIWIEFSRGQAARVHPNYPNIQSQRSKFWHEFILTNYAKYSC